MKRKQSNRENDRGPQKAGWRRFWICQFQGKVILAPRARPDPEEKMVGDILHARYRTKAGHLGVACIGNGGSAPVRAGAGVERGGDRLLGLWGQPTRLVDLVEAHIWGRPAAVRADSGCQGCARQDAVCQDAVRLYTLRLCTLLRLDTVRLDCARVRLDGVRLEIGRAHV